MVLPLQCRRSPRRWEAGSCSVQGATWSVSQQDTFPWVPRQFLGVWQERQHSWQLGKQSYRVLLLDCKPWGKMSLLPPGMFHNATLPASVHSFLFIFFFKNWKSNPATVVKSRCVSCQRNAWDGKSWMCTNNHVKNPLLCFCSRHCSHRAAVQNFLCCSALLLDTDCLTQSPSREKSKEAVKELEVCNFFLAWTVCTQVRKDFIFFSWKRLSESLRTWKSTLIWRWFRWIFCYEHSK